MTTSRRLAVVPALLLVLSACGDDSGAVITEPTSATSTTTTTAPVDTTEATVIEGLGADPVDPNDPLVGAIGDMFEDPFFDTGFHEMGWADERNLLVSRTSIIGEGDIDDLLGVEHLLPAPATTGIGDDQLLLQAFVDYYTGDIVPTAIVLYTQTGTNWAVTASIDSFAMEEALLDTTDYAVLAPGGPVVVQTFVSSFDWTAREFVADVSVLDYFDGFSLVYEGQVQCSIADPVEYTTLSDDGVLRPGDEGEAVEALQNDLTSLGYLSGVVDGKYGPGTSAAVSALQADYWLDVDGRVGPNTQQMIEDLINGTSSLLLASKDGIGTTVFGTPAEAGYAALFNIFGPPDDNTGWFQDGCDGHDWLKATWQGFTAIFTDRDGFRQLDGWEVVDLANLPDEIRIAGGIRPTWTWSDFQAAGAIFDPTYGAFFRMPDLEYNDGRFVNPPTDPPAGGAAISEFGTGTGAFVSC
jgi:hypothetical protein